ncbi:MAG: hypothetical protein K5705_02120 [Oscillospiraceae bacterium]|nr:hypothetical protein [Oscillospiraceae bacterium]
MENDEYTIFAADVAFHENGLQYGVNADATALKVAAKCLRMAMCIRAFFGPVNAEIIFASPVVKENAANKIKEYISEVNSLLSEKEFSCKVELYLNERFKKDIFDEVKELSSDVADTSELFLRSWQLYEKMQEKEFLMVTDL